MSEPDSRYSRQIRFAPFGAEGQTRLRAATVAVIGCGALGTVEAEILARAGVGTLRLIDRDFVEWSNLQRQFLYSESDAADAVPKAIAAAKRLAQVNRDVTLEPLVTDLTPANIEEVLDGVDLIIDGTDNFEARFLINDYAVREELPWIYAAAVGSYGLKLAIIPERTACLRCIYPEPPSGAQPTCETDGVLAPITATIAALACGDALKLLTVAPTSRSEAVASAVAPTSRSEAVASAVASTSRSKTLAWKLTTPSLAPSRLTTVDIWSGEIRQTAPPARDPECPCCVRRDFVHLNGQRRAPISLCGRNAVQIHERSRPVDLAGLAAKLATFATVRYNDFAVRASIDQYELTVFPDGRAIIKGTTDPGIARGLYARYVGM